MWDSVNINGKKTEELITTFRLMTLEELMTEFQNPSTKEDFADGIGRVLLRLERDVEFQQLFKQEMKF